MARRIVHEGDAMKTTLTALVRRLPHASAPVRLGVGLGAAVLLQFVILLLRPRVDLDQFPDWRLVLDLALLAVPAVVTMDLALRPSNREGRDRRGVPVAVTLAVVGAAGMASLPVAHARHPASLAGVGLDLLPRTLQCFGIGAMLTIMVVLVLRSCTSSRRSVVVTLPLVVTAGLVAMVGLQLHCPLTHSLHLWSGHLSVLLMALFGGLAVGRRRAKGSSPSRSHGRSRSSVGER